VQGRRKDFFSGGAIVEFSCGSKKDFPGGGPKVVKISFCPLETKKTTFLAIIY